MLPTEGEGKATGRPSRAEMRARCTPGPAWPSPRTTPSTGVMVFLTPRCCSTWKTKDGGRSPVPPCRLATCLPRLTGPHRSHCLGETAPPSVKCQGPQSKYTACHTPPRATLLVTLRSPLKGEPGKRSARTEPR